MTGPAPARPGGGDAGGPADPARRRLLGLAGLGLAAASAPALGQAVDLGFPGGKGRRELTSAFPGKGSMVLQRIHPPLLETPFEVFDGDVFTPNDRFFVRWHYGAFPTAIDAAAYRLTIGGHVERQQSLGLAELLRLPRFEIAAVNQCSGNSRGLFEPRVAGAQWRHGAMGNARWLGVRLRDVLDLAGVRGGAVAVRFGGMDSPLLAEAPDYLKALDIDHARDGEVMIAFGMNGEQLPLLNGFPCRLVVPGWYSTYWVKMLDAIEVLPAPDTGYWMARAYRIPSAPGADLPPGAHDFPTVPIGRMVPRSWVTSFADGERVAAGDTLAFGGIALGGDCGVAAVDVSADNGGSWHPASLGADHGHYSFRRWDVRLPVAARGRLALMSRCRNTDGVVQPMQPIWNPGGYMRGNIETTTIELLPEGAGA